MLSHLYSQTSRRGRIRLHRAACLQALLCAVFVLATFSSPQTVAQATSKELQEFKRQAADQAAREDWVGAAATLQKAIALDPKDPSLRGGLGLASFKLGRYPDSITNYQDCLRLEPHNVAAEIGLAQSYRAVHNYPEAQRVLERAHRNSPGNSAPLSMLGDLEIELQTYDAAIAHLQAALKLEPGNIEARVRLAAAYKAKGDQADALAQISKILARDPKNALAYFLRAEIYSDQNEDAKALPDAEKVVELQPKNPRGRTLLAKILLRSPPGATPTQATSRCAQAVETLRPVVELQAGDSESLFLLSRAYRCAGQLEEAQKTLEAFEAASQNDRTTKENQTMAKHLVEQANERAVKNDFAGAIELLQQSLEKDPSYGPAYLQLAKLYYSAGDMEKAGAAITQALERNPYQAEFLYVQGKILEREGKFDEALAAFEQTTRVNPKESDAYFEMGVIYQQRKDSVRALAAYKKAVEISPDDPDYKKALAASSSASHPN